PGGKVALKWLTGQDLTVGHAAGPLAKWPGRRARRRRRQRSRAFARARRAGVRAAVRRLAIRPENQYSVLPPPCTMAPAGELGTLRSLQHMPIQTSCPTCATTYNLPDGQRGKRVRCRHCADTFVVGARGEGDEDVPVLDEATEEDLERL